MRVRTKTDVYEGTVLPTPKWIPYEAVTLTTTEYRFPFRIIPMENILEMDDTVVEYKPPVVSEDREVIVTGSGGKKYVVTLGRHKSCTCVGFSFRKSCKHIAEAA